MMHEQLYMLLGRCFEDRSSREEEMAGREEEMTCDAAAGNTRDAQQIVRGEKGLVGLLF
jgi:hypothetical protein